MISYDRLWIVMQEKGIPKTRLITDKILSGQTYTNMVNGGSLTIKSLDKLCKFLNCQPGDILEYIPDSKDVG